MCAHVLCSCVEQIQVYVPLLANQGLEVHQHLRGCVEGEGSTKKPEESDTDSPKNVPCFGGQKFRAFYKAGDQSRYPEIGVLEGEEAAKTEAEGRRLEG